MPKIYEVEFRLQRILQIVVPDDADDAVVQDLVWRKQDDLLAFSPLDVEVTLADTCTLEEAAGLDAEWRLTDDGAGFATARRRIGSRGAGPAGIVFHQSRRGRPEGTSFIPMS